uniref:Uncharacterized protein n=1 Tax=Oryza punctata TaxID=4537 RepID=A0A0E0KA89_ORYPU
MVATAFLSLSTASVPGKRKPWTPQSLRSLNRRQPIHPHPAVALALAAPHPTSPIHLSHPLPVPSQISSQGSSGNFDTATHCSQSCLTLTASTSSSKDIRIAVLVLCLHKVGFM